MSATGGVGPAGELAQVRERVWQRARVAGYMGPPATLTPAEQSWLAAVRDSDTLLAHADALESENTRLRAQLAPVAYDYPAAVFRELWRVLGELRAGTGEEGRA